MRCKGGCKKVSRTPNAINWVKWQMCYHCAYKNHPEYYKDKRRHGTGGTYLKPAKFRDFYSITLTKKPIIRTRAKKK